MLLQTKYFCEADCEHLLRFEKGLFGFEEEKEFFLLVTKTALGNMSNVAEEYGAQLHEEVAGDE